RCGDKQCLCLFGYLVYTTSASYCSHLQPVPQEDLPILAPDHIRVDIPDKIDDGGLEIEPAIYDMDDDDDDEEDVQKVVNDNDSEGNDLNWEDIDSFDDGIVFDDDDFEDEETAVERM